MQSCIGARPFQHRSCASKLTIEPTALGALRRFKQAYPVEPQRVVSVPVQHLPSLQHIDCFVYAFLANI
ncbi:hypothetical protein FYA67_10365 [Bordetella holmesii]|nr:hypothetical protein BTL46_10205 [Bordetella holmesii]AUL23143.1 hypothetical protein BTL48_10265 [Bordetella holmesii]AUL26456.1 hypothetical protein BTL49_10280 [Bordetella holmesii]AUL29800.1 hypothetical protein BTL50_10260 [Bordetella holmesii]AUL33128.1 hypothetical protein BTL51_10265 [Bordetella holmesii]